MSEVSFYYADVSPVKLKNKTDLKQFLEDLFKKEGKFLQRLSIIFCSDVYLLKINRSFLQHDYYTDVITFDLSPSSEMIDGEIYVSTDRVRENAITHGSLLQLEMLRVIFHGTLHLCGYRDKTKSEITMMREKEDYYLNKFCR